MASISMAACSQDLPISCEVLDPRSGFGRDRTLAVVSFGFLAGGADVGMEDPTAAAAPILRLSANIKYQV